MNMTPTQAIKDAQDAKGEMLDAIADMGREGRTVSTYSRAVVARERYLNANAIQQAWGAPGDPEAPLWALKRL